MNEIGLPAAASLTGAVIGCLGTLGWLTWKRQWSRTGLFVATGCLIACVAHLQMLVQLLFELNYAGNPASIGAVTWNDGLLGGSLLLATSLIFFAAMVAAMRPPTRWGAACICLASGYILWTTGAWSVERWIAAGVLPSMSFGIEWPVWMGFPAFLGLICGPFIVAIPWSLTRQARTRSSEAAGILAYYRAVVGTLAILLAIIGGSIALGLLQDQWALDARATRVVTILGLALILTVAVTFAMMTWFRRSFLTPAIAMLEGVKQGQPITDSGRLNAIWRPFADILADRDQRAADYLKHLSESQAQMQAFLDNAPVAMSFVDPATQELVMINRAGAAYYGRMPEDMLGFDAASLRSHYADFDNFRASIAATYADRKSHVFEAEFLDHKHETRKFLVTSFPVLGPSGTVDLLGQIFVDITRQRQTEANLNEAQAQLIGFFDNLPTSIYLKTIDHEVIYVSKHLADQYGKRPEDMVGKYEYDLHIDEMKPLLQAMDEHIMSTGQAVLTEGRHLQFDRLELVSRFPVFNDRGEITHIGGMNFDIDARAKAQAELAESKALIDAFIQNAPNSMVLMDLTGRYVMYNETAAANFGKTSAEMLQMKPSQIAARFPEAASVILPMFERVAKSLVMESTEVQFVMPSGELRDFYFSFFPILGADGKLAYIGNISHDITAERRAQAELANSTDALHQSEKLAALGQLLAGVSHELNNPLAAVIGQSELLAEDLEGTQHAERVGKIRRAADRCARIVHSFLAMARQRAPEYRKASLNELVLQAIELTDYQMRTANVVIDLQLGDNLPLIEADGDQLHQVIVNLLTNARQATDENTDERRITIATTRSRGQVTLRIADNGKGIPAEARARIFEPFFSTKQIGSGTGIGLSYSLGIVEMHGGTLTLEDVAQGSAFAITLPIAKGGVTQDVADLESPANAKGRALVIDDEADIAETLVDMLARTGLDVTYADGGAAGLAAMAGDAQFDLIFSDIRMPDIDGPALHDWMGSHRPDLLGRLAFVTGDTMSERAAEFLARADCPVLEKPFTAAALRGLVDRMMNP